MADLYEDKGHVHIYVTASRNANLLLYFNDRMSLWAEYSHIYCLFQVNLDYMNTRVRIFHMVLLHKMH